MNSYLGTCQIDKKRGWKGNIVQRCYSLIYPTVSKHWIARPCGWHIVRLFGGQNTIFVLPQLMSLFRFIPNRIIITSPNYIFRVHPQSLQSIWVSMNWNQSDVWGKKPKYDRQIGSQGCMITGSVNYKVNCDHNEYICLNIYVSLHHKLIIGLEMGVFYSCQCDKPTLHTFGPYTPRSCFEMIIIESLFYASCGLLTSN